MLTWVLVGAGRVRSPGMDVPFLSSSAINREHYNLVQSVEAASTLQQVDDILIHKVNVVRRRFDTRSLTSVSCTWLVVSATPSHSPQSECMPSLTLLLYCWTATSLGQVTRAMLEFALPQAITLAESGSTLKAKRIGTKLCLINSGTGKLKMYYRLPILYRGHEQIR